MANPIVQQINAELKNLEEELKLFKSTVEYLNGAKTVVKDAVLSVNKAEEHFFKKAEELKNTYDAIINLRVSVSAVVSKIDKINFPERLDSIEKTVKETINYLDETRKATLEELQKASEIITKADFDGRFKELQNTVDTSVNSNKMISKVLENQRIPEKIDDFSKNIKSNLDLQIADLKKNTKQIAEDSAKSIFDLNLPIRIDKLDANIAGILSAIQNVQNRIESVDRNIGDKLRETSEKQTAILNAFKENVNHSILALSKDIKDVNKKQQINLIITCILIVAATILLMLK